MKNILSITLLCLLACSAGAQKIVEKQVDLSPGAVVRINVQIADSIKIISWNKNSAYVKASINMNENKDNDYYKVTFDGSSNEFEMKAKLDFPKGYRNNCNCNCDWHDSINVVVYVPENAEVVVETINGNITVSGKVASIRAKSISGFVDVPFSPETKADVHLSTISGAMYSDLDLRMEDKNLHRVGGTRITKAFNGGGKPFDLETISGDIFLRKG